MDHEKFSKKLVRAIIYTSNNLQIEGMVYTGQELRLSDELNLNSKKLLFIKNANFKLMGTEISSTHEVVFVDRSHIVMISPQEQA